MPVKLKDLSEDQSHLQFSEVAEIEAIYHEPSESHASVVKFFAPKSYVAKTEFEKRKETQNNHKLWLENIVNQKNALQLNQQRLQQKIANERKNGGSGGVGI